MKVFLDTNMILDVLREREPFVHCARRVWLMAEHGKILGQVSVLSFANIYYIARKYKGAGPAVQMLRTLRANFTLVPCDEHVIDRALAAELPDFEDAIQYFSALRAKADCLLTRDPSHYPGVSLGILSPEQFLATYMPE